MNALQDVWKVNECSKHVFNFDIYTIVSHPQNILSSTKAWNHIIGQLKCVWL